MCNEDVFNGLYKDSFCKVYSYFSVCFNEDVAADLSQQVFEKVWRKIQCPDSFYPENWKAWIFRVAVNTKNDHLRKKYSAPETVALDENTFYESSYEDVFLDTFSIEKALGLLCGNDRDILLLKANGMKSHEIGDILDISASAARSRIVEARKRFKRNLELLGVDNFE